MPDESFDLSIAENGPRCLFFSGGTALRGVSRELMRHTANSVHVITPYDSGGSSAVLRRAFGMPAVGDIRNRLMALADLSEKGGREIFALFTYRFSRKESNADLAAELRRIAQGKHILVNLLPETKRPLIQDHIQYFLQVMPADFDLRGASIGNIVLTAGYLSHGRRLAPVIEIFSRLAGVRGAVCPAVDRDLHLAAELADGDIVVGQHLLTGKETGPLSSPIKRVWQTQALDSAAPVVSSAERDVCAHIESADLICYPVGSFYSSVVANLLPQGIGACVAANPCPKVFVPNPVGDPELLGHGVTDQVRVLRRYLQLSGAPEAAEVLGIVLVDRNQPYPGGLDISALEHLGVTVVDTSLASAESAPCFDPVLLTEALLSCLP
ncbi:GAK system CofD-like protein [Pseudodesulfovibrio piezophilus]|uniref:GAK system CofD-like protein n=1 Tax=Pseudodesulfovibrio piezophilus (strain DSM 21447 / JCM 15486 / C1TLV30) TaxID=1322246 RepID=M1WKQ0_PSEP2|nr:GAK system CofD-like protein [Pseudodesulfovibrio piezophilus]CCH49986.1 conserved protein of unknown function [Pseudodesulfovibrio piezophilus C1TLV30]